MARPDRSGKAFHGDGLSCLHTGMSLDPDAEAPTLKNLKMAKCRYMFGDECIWKIFWLKEDGVW
jgi:hypothetical protein